MTYDAAAGHPAGSPSPHTQDDSVDLNTLPPTVGIELAARLLGCGRTQAYELARRGEFPRRVLRLGRRHVLSSADLLRLLGMPPTGADGNTTGPPGGLACADAGAAWSSERRARRSGEGWRMASKGSRGGAVQGSADGQAARHTLGAAVKKRRLQHNAAAHIELPDHARPKAVVWTEQRVAAWRRDAHRAGPPPIRLHDLRHGEASLMQTGIDMAVVSKRLGHSTITITSDTYAHMLEGVGRDGAERARALVPRQPGDHHARNVRLPRSATAGAEWKTPDQEGLPRVDSNH